MAEAVYIVNEGLNPVIETKPGFGTFHFPVRERVKIGPEVRKTKVGGFTHETVVQTALQVAESILRDFQHDKLRIVVADENEITASATELKEDVRDAVKEIKEDVKEVVTDITTTVSALFAKKEEK